MIKKYSLLQPNEVSNIISKMDGELKPIIKRLATEKGMSYTSYLNMILIQHVEKMRG